MKIALKNKIRKFLDICEKLEARGYSIQGLTTDNEIAVEKKDKIFTFKNIYAAKKSLLKSD